MSQPLPQENESLELLSDDFSLVFKTKTKTKKKKSDNPLRRPVFNNEEWKALSQRESLENENVIDEDLKLTFNQPKTHERKQLDHPLRKAIENNEKWNTLKQKKLEKFGFVPVDSFRNENEFCRKLIGYIGDRSMVNDQWRIYDTPPLSDVEAKLRPLLVELGNDNKIHGVQVCAYKDGNVIIDTAGGVLEKDDDRPVQPDSLFPVFSVTKGITAGMLHWLIDAGKLKLGDSVTNIWPEFGSNGKDLIKVHHVLNHTSGLHNALADIGRGNPFLMANWEQCLKSVVMSEPETEPGQEQTYHYLSYGYICGGIIEHASGKKFQEILEEAFIHPLQIEGELYIGIPSGVEARLASLAPYEDDLKKLSEIGSRVDLPSSIKPDSIVQVANMVPALFNMLNIRRAIIPAANAHCSARALARYYASLVDGGAVPPPHSSSPSTPPLGSHPHIPHSPALSSISPKKEELFSNPKIHDAFLGVGEYANLVKPDGAFGLGFKRCHHSKDSSLTGFGHSGMGGSTGFCDIQNRFAIAVTLNKMSFGAETAKIIQLVCSELNISVPQRNIQVLKTVMQKFWLTDEGWNKPSDSK